MNEINTDPMKKKYILMSIAVLCAVIAGCDRRSDCSQEREVNYGRALRPPRFYSSTYMVLSDFTEHYWDLVDGDTLRLKAYLRQVHRQNGDAADGYYLSLHGTPLDNEQSTKGIISDYIEHEKMIIVSPRVTMDPYYLKYIVRDIPYVTEDCYDTLKRRLCEVEGIIRFVHYGDVGYCAEACYLLVSDWDNQLSHILNQEP